MLISSVGRRQRRTEVPRCFTVWCGNVKVGSKLAAGLTVFFGDSPILETATPGHGVLQVLDCILDQLCELRSCPIKFIYVWMGDNDKCKLLTEKLFPETTKRGLVEVLQERMP